MTLKEALSDRHIDALVEANAIAKDKEGKGYTVRVTRLLKNGYWAEVVDREGRKHLLRVKKDGSLTIINYK